MSTEMPENNTKEVVIKLQTLIERKDMLQIKRLEKQLGEIYDPQLRLMFGKVYGETGIAMANRKAETSEEYVAALNEAVFYFLRSQKYEPENGLLLSNMGTAFEQLGKIKYDKHLLERSIDMFEQASTMQGVPDLSYNIANTYTDFATSAPIDAGYYEKADAYFEKALSSGSAPPLTRLHWANSIVAHARRMHFNQDLMKQAFEQFERCHIENPQEGVVIHDWGLAWLETGSYNKSLEAIETAITFFERAEKMRYCPVTLYASWGDALALLGRLEGFDDSLLKQALQKYEEAKALDKTCAYSFFECGNLLVEMASLSVVSLEKLQNGIDNLARAADLAPDNDNIHNCLGNALLTLAIHSGNTIDILMEAVKVFDKAVAIDAKQFAGFANLGSIYFKLGKLEKDNPAYYAKSERAFLDAIQLNRMDTQLTGQILASLPEFEKHQLKYTVTLVKWVLKSYDEIISDDPLFEMIHKEQIEQLKSNHRY